MKPSLTVQFDSLEEMQEFLEAVNGLKTEIKMVTLPTTDATAPLPTPEGKKERKPRSDAGQPRGPYKRKEETQSPAQGDEAAAPATQTPVATPPTAPAAAAPEAPKGELTITDVRAAMTGRSTEKNIALLKKFGAMKSSDLPTAKYADFIAACKRGE